jgi:tubulin monoglycylase TTLL3/8
MNKLQENYRKLVNRFIHQKRQDNNKNILTQNNVIESRNISNLENLDKIIQNKKKLFIVTGSNADVVKNLTNRGWEKNPDVKSLDFNYIWTIKAKDINFNALKPFQLCNHFSRSGEIARKSGLCKNIKNLYYNGIDPMNFFPRCYDLSIKDELEDFEQDFKFTWAISLLKLFQKEKNGNISLTFSKKLSSEIISTAIGIVNRNLSLIEKKVYLNEIVNNKKTYLVTDEEWNIIYIQELTHNSNVQDIIFEVNSNKPGGVNNPIKENKTVSKNKIKKANDIERMLVNIQKEQIDTYKFSPNLKNVSELKAGISPIKEEEKKMKKMPIKKFIQSNLKKNNLNINNGASFETFLPKVTDILQRQEKSLPQYKLNGYKNIWILKPSNLSRGRGVTCVDSLQPIEQSLIATNNYGLVIQKYIENPLII